MPQPQTPNVFATPVAKKPTSTPAPALPAPAPVAAAVAPMPQQQQQRAATATEAPTVEVAQIKHRWLALMRNSIRDSHYIPQSELNVMARYSGDDTWYRATVVDLGQVDLEDCTKCTFWVKYVSTRPDHERLRPIAPGIEHTPHACVLEAAQNHIGGEYGIRNGEQWAPRASSRVMCVTSGVTTGSQHSPRPLCDDCDAASAPFS